MTWQLTEDDVESLRIGAGVLGAGGGGSPYLGALQLRELLRQGARVEIVPVSEVADSDLGCAIGGMGAPTVSVEKLARGNEMWQAVQTLQRHVGRDFRFLICGEIGGANALRPLIAAAYGHLPVVDADPMGRAFPELQMDTFLIYGMQAAPLALHDAHGNSAVLQDLRDARAAERLGRSLTIAMGGTAALAMPVLSGRQAKDLGILGTLSLARRIGQAVREARAAKDDPIDAMSAVLPLQRLFNGKVVDLERRTTQGFARGRVTLEGLGADSGRTLAIDIQNEFLIAYLDDKPLVTVPDIISLVEEESGLPIGTEALRYGLRLEALGIPAATKLKTPRALDVVGPRAFGYDVDFTPLAGDLPEQAL